MPSPADFRALVERLRPYLLRYAALQLRDAAAAEDAVQEALLAAALQWPAEGVPDSPRGWLIAVAARRLIDWRRRESARDARASLAPPGTLSFPACVVRKGGEAYGHGGASGPRGAPAVCRARGLR